MGYVRLFLAMTRYTNSAPLRAIMIMGLMKKYSEKSRPSISRGTMILTESTIKQLDWSNPSPSKNYLSSLHFFLAVNMHTTLVQRRALKVIFATLPEVESNLWFKQYRKDIEVLTCLLLSYIFASCEIRDQSDGANFGRNYSSIGW